MSEVTSVVSNDDLNKLMSLMREYTMRLRELCEHSESYKFRMTQTVGMSVTLIGSVGASLTYIVTSSKELNINQAIPLAIILIGAAFGSLYYLTIASLSRRSQYVYQAASLAATVERLMKLCSQYSEHSATRIADKFEFDLRIAEAEAALYMYAHVFDVDGRSRQTRKPKAVQ